ncbi:MAG: hypothetical protein H6Q57_2304 [Geobacteraceae bacterium]|nr:hypothetical protein [Geobacteraceae bacterium]
MNHNFAKNSSCPDITALRQVWYQNAYIPVRSTVKRSDSHVRAIESKGRTGRQHRSQTVRLESGGAQFYRGDPTERRCQERSRLLCGLGRVAFSLWRRQKCTGCETPRLEVSGYPGVVKERPGRYHPDGLGCCGHRDPCAGLHRDRAAVGIRIALNSYCHIGHREYCGRPAISHDESASVQKPLHSHDHGSEQDRGAS